MRQCLKTNLTKVIDLSVELGKLVAGVKEKIELADISNRIIGIDAYNTIYQFLSIIRQPDGTPLMDEKGNVTSHLSGILYRTLNLLENNITPVFVFDGMPPLLKRRTLEARAMKRNAAMMEWKSAREEGRTEEARMHAMASTKINREIVEGSKKLLECMGIPFMQAPSEGEAQSAVLAKKGLVYASASQDYDSFLFGARIVIRNLAISGKRKLPGKNIYINISTERIFLKDLLDSLQIGQEQLVLLGMLMGTDFNAGINKVGPKTALKIVKENKTPGEVVGYIKRKYGAEFDADPNEVIELFMKPDVEDVSEDAFGRLISRCKPDSSSIIRFMCEEHGFSKERVSKIADRLCELKGLKGQKGINSWM